MANTYTRIGVDLRDNTYYAARVLHGMGRPQVKALIRYKKDNLTNHELLNSGKVILSIPENMAIVKRIKLDVGKVEDFKNRGCFEILQSIPDDPDDYCCEILETSVSGTYLGIATRKKLLKSSIIDPFYKNANLNEIPGAQVRGVALGIGYITYCHYENGDLVALVDVHDKMASICFVYKRKIMSVAHLMADEFDFNNERGIESFAVELKTLINYNLNSIFNDNATLPLSALLISGMNSIEQVLPVLRKYFLIRVGTPRINNGFFSDPDKIAGVQLEKYLIALGLAIN